MNYNNGYLQDNKMQPIQDISSLPNAVYTVNINLAEVLRIFSEGMVTAYNLGLMERNMRAEENAQVMEEKQCKEQR